jgi:NAD+ synthase (glutamine-hydrolysing)
MAVLERPTQEGTLVHVALAQLNSTVGDVHGNARRISEAVARAADGGAQIVAVPELAITGYPPEDLLLKPSFVDANVAALESVARAVGDVVAIVGFVEPRGGRLYNAAAVCHHGEVVAVYRKHLLPNYGVFDERRYFEPGTRHVLAVTAEGVVGVTVCEDAWDTEGPIVAQGDAGAGVVININASPFHKGKLVERASMLGERARRARAAIVYVNAVGGQDELVFDGGSLVIDNAGEVQARLPQFEEDFAIVDVPVEGAPREIDGAEVESISVELRPPTTRPQAAPPTPELSEAEEIYRALCLAVRDYAHKNGFEKVVLGLSGGVDSSLVAAIATDALGRDAVLGVVLPSDFSTSHSRTDAKELVANLGIDMLEIPISALYDAYREVIEAALGAHEPGLAEENLQARIRGNLWMFVSNRYGHLVLVTGNKSEGACGYATLYGDMAGGFAPIKDVLKTEVYELCRYRNALEPLIPENVLTKAPSAELRHDQKDEDSLPPYQVLDPILEAYIEDDASIEDIVASGHDRDTVAYVVGLVDRAEYKRRQAPPGPKVTTKAFGRDRRLPISNAWRDGVGSITTDAAGERSSAEN